MSHFRGYCLEIVDFGAILLKNMRSNKYPTYSLVPLVALACLFSLFSGCRKKIASPAAVPVQSAQKLPSDTAPQAITPAITAPLEPAPEAPVAAPSEMPESDSLNLGEASFRTGSYSKAARSFEAYLRQNPGGPDRDAALFRLGLSFALADGSGRSMRRAEEALKRLVSEFPESLYRGPAEFIIGLQSQVESLKADIKERDAKIKLLGDELQKLKEIDLQRRPSRPSY